jgi:uncharacterized protein YjiK
MSSFPAARIGAALVFALACPIGIDSAFSQSDSSSSSGGRALPHYDLSGPGTRRFKLPSELAEISGLAFTPDGRLLAHGDERGVIWQIDPATGVPANRFGFGNHGRLLHGDFEDIQVVGQRVFLVTSDGKIFEAGEPSTSVVVDAMLRSAGLAGACEVEGLASDPPTGALLVLCKHAWTKRWRRSMVILAVSTNTWKFEPQPRILIRQSELERVTGERQFNGTAIVRHPRTGSYILLAGPQRAYAEVTSAGDVIGGGKLPSELHRQAEGIAIGPDLTLYISDEAAGKHATLTAYAYHP